MKHILRGVLKIKGLERLKKLIPMYREIISVLIFSIFIIFTILKPPLITILTLGLFACNQPYTYKPGFGEFMMNIQTHHSKLWFAGQNQNWKLAAFEIHEIKEAIEGIQKFQSARKESQTIEMLNLAIDTVNNAIQQKNPLLFKNSFVLLTNTCNNCHQAVNFEFNIMKVPDTSPFSNQEFRLNEQK